MKNSENLDANELVEVPFGRKPNKLLGHPHYFLGSPEKKLAISHFLLGCSRFKLAFPRFFLAFSHFKRGGRVKKRG